LLFGGRQIGNYARHVEDWRQQKDYKASECRQRDPGEERSQTKAKSAGFDWVVFAEDGSGSLDEVEAERQAPRLLYAVAAKKVRLTL
jgi:hypothetical protein